MSNDDNKLVKIKSVELERLTEHLHTLNESVNKLRSAIQTLNTSPSSESKLEASLDADIQEITKLLPNPTLH